jgi:hypothetical protein
VSAMAAMAARRGGVVAAMEAVRLGGRTGSSRQLMEAALAAALDVCGGGASWRLKELVVAARLGGAWPRGGRQSVAHAFGRECM